MLIKRKASNLIENSLNLYSMLTFLYRNNKYQFLLLFCLIIAISGIGQINTNKKVISTGYSKTVSAGINISYVEFSQTHPLGVGANFSWSKHRFGLMEKKLSKPFGFIAEGGIDYYFGKDETVSGYSYKYNGFTYIHAYGGAIYNCGKRGNINLTTGPALGLEDGFTSFFLGANLSGAYFINNKIAVTPGIKYMQDLNGPDPLVSFFFKAGFAF